MKNHFLEVDVGILIANTKFDIVFLSQVVKTFLIPRVKYVSDRMKATMEGLVVNNADKIAAENIKRALSVSIIPLTVQSNNVLRPSSIFFHCTTCLVANSS